MDRAGRWSLCPAFDVTYNFKVDGEWTARHQMTLNGKRDDFVIEDLARCADVVSMQRGRAMAIVAEVAAEVAQWPAVAAEVGVPKNRAIEIGKALRLELRPR